MSGVDIEALLTEHEACSPGMIEALTVFGRRLPPGVPVAWAVAVAAGVPRLQSWVGWAVGRLCRPEEVGVIAGADLSWAYLSWSDLRGADLGCADLSGADLSWSDLSEADLSDANLSLADLSWSDLRGADLGCADLRGADLDDALRLNTDPPLEGWVVVDGRLRRAE